MNLRPFRLFALLAAAAAFSPGAARAGVVATFDDLALAPNSAFQGPMPGHTTVDGPYGDVAEGTFASGGVSFINRYDTTYGSWSGFAYSNQTNTTNPSWTNQFSTYAGAARSGSNFGVAFGYHDVQANMSGNPPFDPLDVVHLEGLPHFSLPVDAAIEGMYVTNTTYTALSLLRGDDFADKLGGADGKRADWYKMTAYGADASGNVLVDALGAALAVDFYLADNRQGQLFIADAWSYMDLSALAAASRVYFNVSGSAALSGLWGLNTPAYFAVDDIAYNTGAGTPAVPEPASLAMAGIAVAVVGLVARRRPRA